MVLVSGIKLRHLITVFVLGALAAKKGEGAAAEPAAEEAAAA